MWVSLPIKIIWLFGFSVSTVGLIFQALIYVLIPCSRKFNHKILTQITVARLLNIAFEYMVLCVRLKTNALNVAVFALYVQTDAAMICWMFTFSKNLYDGFMNAFAPKSSFTLMSVIVWCVTIPVGLLCPLLLELDIGETKHHRSYFDTFYTIYAYLKFIVLAMSLVMFGIIFKTAMLRTDRVVSVLRTCVVSFVLVSISGLQVLLTDLCSNFMDAYPVISLAFSVINSYQVVAITGIFVILVQKSCENESFSEKLAKKFIRSNV